MARFIEARGDIPYQIKSAGMLWKILIPTRRDAIFASKREASQYLTGYKRNADIDAAVQRGLKFTLVEYQTPSRSYFVIYSTMMGKRIWGVQRAKGVV